MSLTRGLCAILAGSLLSTCGSDASPNAPALFVPSPASSCSGFVVTGDPRGSSGARWTYRDTDSGVAYALEGVLFAPAGAGPFPAVVVSHGKGGSPTAYSARLAATMVSWNLVVIGPEYTHAGAADGDTGLPAGADGASTANVSRARKARQLLSCLGYVDMSRVAAHGHSMGAFVTGELLGTDTRDFRVASHTAGGATSQPAAAATHTSTAERIITPYQLHHGDQDEVVALAADQELARILSRHGVSHELKVYRGYDHAQIAADPGMLDAVRAWYTAHGLLGESRSRSARLVAQYEERAERREHVAEVQEWARRLLRRVRGHGDEHVDERRASEHQRHDERGRAPGAKGPDDAHGAQSAQGAAERGRHDAGRAESLELALRRERRCRYQHPDEEVGDPHAQKGLQRIAQRHLTAVQRGPVEAPGQHGSGDEHQPMHRVSYSNRQ
jgi:dienelactone hydrolase